MKSEYAEIAAYSSQFVDDAVNRHALKFQNGIAFKQTQTAHRMLIPRSSDFNDALDVWIPFHYPPRADGDDTDSMITAPNSKVLGLLLEDVRTSSGPNSLYRLGIGLHYLADAYAHTDFKGIYDRYNDVQLLSGINEKGFIEDTGRKISARLLDRWSSADSNTIGHTEVMDNPDIPYAQWSYSRGSKVLRVNNLEDRCLPAIRKMHEYLVYFLSRNHTYTSGRDIKPFDSYEERFRQLLACKGSKEERYKNWIKSIKNNYFEFSDFNDRDKALFYNEDVWFKQAVDTTKLSKGRSSSHKQYNYNVFKKAGFEESHWLRFMQAAAEHRFLIIHCLLPELGIIVG